jgi:hypothetical protein
MSMVLMPCSFKRRHVLRQLAAREQAAVHAWVQGLDAAVEHLWEAA